jgi:DNA-binding NarL/FixJ family response regulator
MAERRAKSGKTADGNHSEGQGGSRRIRVLVVDDHPSIRRMLLLVLEKEPDIEVVGQATEGEAAARMARDLRPDVVLMDVSMPGTDGVAATRLIHAELPEVRVLGLTVFAEEDAGERMRQAGAVGFLSKHEAIDKLAEAIRKCVKRGA